jgi:hypothetical protein
MAIPSDNFTSVFGIMVAFMVVVWKNICLVKTVVEIEVEQKVV